MPPGLGLRPGGMLDTISAFSSCSLSSGCCLLTFSLILWKSLNGSMGANAFTAVFEAHCGSPPPGLACAMMVILVLDGSSGSLERTGRRESEQYDWTKSSKHAVNQSSMATYNWLHARHSRGRICPPSPFAPMGTRDAHKLD